MWCGVDSSNVMEWRLRYIWGGGGKEKNMGWIMWRWGPVSENKLPGGGEGQGEGATLYL
tara:strand:- start:4425 stop:4601 length:177 start_codon:yes stop_codon:yes gene_type:complete